MNGSINPINTTAISVRASLEKQSLMLLISLQTPNLLTAVASFIAVITNGLIVITVAKTKQLHNKNQYVICSHAIPECFYGMSMFAISLRKYLMSVLGMTDVMNRPNCMCMLLILIVTSKVAVFAIFILGLDRLLAITLPIRYKTLNRVKYVLLLNAFCWGIVFVHIPFMFIGLDPTELVPFCQYALAVPAGYYYSDNVETQVLVIITITVYAVTIGVLAIRYWGSNWQNETERVNWSREVQMNAFKMMMAAGCIYLASWGIGQVIMYFLARYSTPTTAAMYGPYVALLLISNTASHFFVYFGLSSSFRKACKKLLMRQKATHTVPPFGLHQTGLQ